MATFTAKIKAGNSIQEVVITAKTTNEAKQEAEKQGYVLSIKRRHDLFSAGLSYADRIIFLERLSSMIASKVGVSDSLILMRDNFKGAISDVARLLQLRIEAGDSLAEAMESAGPKYFSESLAAIVKAGSQGGNMVLALREAIRFEEEFTKIKKTSSEGLIPSLFGFFFGAAILLSSTYYFAPKMLNSDLFKSFPGVDIGWVLVMADYLNWTVGIALIAAISISMLVFVARPAFPELVDRFLMKMPGIRDLVLAKRCYISFFGLSVLMRAGLRVEEALRLAQSITPRGQMRNDLEAARQAVIDGSYKSDGQDLPWPHAMKSLHPTDRASLSTAEDRVQVANAVSEIANQYKRLYQTKISIFVPSIKAFSGLLVLLSGVVLFGVVILPLLQITEIALKTV